MRGVEERDCATIEGAHKGGITQGTVKREQFPIPRLESSGGGIGQPSPHPQVRPTKRVAISALGH